MNKLEKIFFLSLFLGKMCYYLIGVDTVCLYTLYTHTWVFFCLIFWSATNSFEGDEGVKV